MRRGDNIPSVSDYSHWNEEAEAMWYAENRYDMEHADEEMDDDFEDLERNYYEPEPDIEFEFKTEEEARECFENIADWGFPEPHSLSLHSIGDTWYVDGYSKELGAEAVEINRKRRMSHYA